MRMPTFVKIERQTNILSKIVDQAEYENIYEKAMILEKTAF
jgi:hypothetical protein